MAITEAPLARTHSTDRARSGGGGRRSVGSGGDGPRRPYPSSVYVRRRVVVAVVVIALLVGGLLVISRFRDGNGGGAQTAPTPTVPAAQPVTTEAAPLDAVAVPVDAAPVDGLADSGGDVSSDLTEDVACQLDEVEVRLGDSGESVACAQRALFAAGYYDGAISGEFDEATDLATRNFQADFLLYVDGIVGKNTATDLGIWPGGEHFVVRTPPPPPGATDLWGMPLSSVASAGDDAPPLPEDAGQGTGKRVVYERASQRVWAIDDEERIVRSYLVTGSRYRNEVPGVHTVFSKSEEALGWDLTAKLPYMIRYIKTERGNIGFHAIPYWIETGEKLQTEDELGQKLSGGCTRQAPADARFLWEFADVGTKVWLL